MFTRRTLMSGSAGLVATSIAGKALAQSKPTLVKGLSGGLTEAATLEALPGKKPLIKLSYRPPNYETPLSVFKSVITPNDLFFVRWHLADIPEIDVAKWTLKVDGKTPLTLTMAQLKADFEPVEVVAVCQCSGNRRGLFDPHIPGVQWGYGAMGNARWKGARLKDVLNKAGVPEGTIEIQFNGADKPVLDKTPDLIKTIPLAKALDDNTLIAYEMNGEPLPHFNGFPARIIIPGWTGAYWIKSLTDVVPLNKPDTNFWMQKAYRVPTGMFPATDRFVSQETDVNTPITEILINSLITSHEDGQSVSAGKHALQGIAWDGGHGITDVDVSLDGGNTWSAAHLKSDYGRFSFSEWSFDLAFEKPGKATVMVKAANAIGQSQVSKLLINPAGYYHNAVQQLTLNVT